MLSWPYNLSTGEIYWSPSFQFYLPSHCNQHDLSKKEICPWEFPAKNFFHGYPFPISRLPTRIILHTCFKCSVQASVTFFQKPKVHWPGAYSSTCLPWHTQTSMAWLSLVKLSHFFTPYWLPWTLAICIMFSCILILFTDNNAYIALIFVFPELILSSRERP